MPGYRQRAQPPVHLFLTRVTTTILTEAASETENGSSRVLKDEWRGFLVHKSQVTNTNGQEVNFIYLVCRTVFLASRWSRVLGGIARLCRD